MTIPLSSIDESNRETSTSLRQNSEDLAGLVDSIRAVGLIQPLVLNRAGERFELVAGGRRKRALQTLGIAELHHGTTCDPQRPGFVFADELTEDQRLEIELDENLHRLNLGWSEEVLLIARTHEAKKRNAALEGQKWGYRHTGVLLNVSLGDLSNTLAVAECLRTKDKQILEATSFAEALRVLLQRKEDEVHAELVRRGLGVPKDSSVPSNIVTDVKPKKRAPGEVVVLFEDDDDATPVSRSSSEQDGQEAPGIGSILEIPLSSMLHFGKWEEVSPKFPDGFFDHHVTDIPYGIDMDNLDLQNLDRVKDTHDVMENAEMMPEFLKEAYRTLKDGGYLVLFYDLMYQERLHSWATKIGYKVQRWPIIWCKTHPCRNQAPQYNTTKNFETAYVMRKGNVTLNRPQNTSWFPLDGALERKMYDNPFAKPFELWKVIFDMIALPGQSIADYFAGEGSSTRAAIMCGLKPYTIEMDKRHYDRQVEHVKTAYSTLTRNKCTFI